jgi:uncharacterized ParB-like nuclease family protein
VEDASYPNNPANKELLRTVAGDHSPVGMINQPIKGAKLVNIPIEMIEHGEAVMPGGTLTFAGARKKIEEYAKKETPIPPIDVVSGEGGKPWMVADGSHRLEAAKLRGEKTIPAYVSPHDKEGLEQIAKFKMNAKDAKPSKVAQTSDGYKFYEQPDGTWTNGDMTFKSIDELFSTDPQLTVNGKIYSPKAWMKEESKGSDVHTLDYDRTFDPNYDASKGTFAHLYKKGFR